MSSSQAAPSPPTGRAPVIKLSSRATQDFWEIPILFEDAQLLAINKPAGLLTSPDRFNPERVNLMALLHADIARGAAWAQPRQLTYLTNTHRLDAEASGVLLLAKTKPALISLANQFGAERPHTVYVALAHGSPAEPTFRVDLKLAPHPLKPGLMRTNRQEGKKAFTDFEVRELFKGYALLTCRPLTARPHQIRVHLQNRRLSIVGDAGYGGRPLLLSRLKRDYEFKPDEPERPLMGRAALHLEELNFTHPETNQPVRLTAPWPKDLTVAVKYLRRFAP